MNHPGLRRSETTFETTSGDRLFCRAWLPPTPTARVILVHGLAEHSGRYEALSAWLAVRGIAVHALDLRGHGRSGGPPVYIRRFDHFLDDLELFLARSTREHDSIPTVLLGVSLGGLIVARFLEQRRPKVDGAVLVNPALAVGPGISSAQVRFARVLRSLFPRLRMPGRLDPSDISRDENEARAYQEDPWVRERVTTSLAIETLAAMEALSATIEVPVLLLHGGADRICPSEGSRRYAEKLGTPRSDLRIYPEYRHALLHEFGREEIYRDIYEWIMGLET